MKNYKWIDLITAAFVGTLIISNVASTKIVQAGPFTFDGGTVLFPIAYIFGDVLTEVYGYKRSKRVIWTGFFWMAVAAVVFVLIDIMPPAVGYELSSSFHAVLGQLPRIVAGSLLGYFAGSFSNSVILAKMKVLTQGKWLWTRTIGSTIVGEAADSAVFLGVAFFGVLPIPLLITLFVSNYLFKVGVETLFTPVTYKIIRFLKRAEQEDYYDNGTNFSPFSTKQ